MDERPGRKVLLTSRAFHKAILGKWTKRVKKITKKYKVLPMNTDVKAVETSIKAARRWVYQEKEIEKLNQKLLQPNEISTVEL